MAGEVLDIFTDSSCLYPRDPECRVAAFAVVHAAPVQFDYDPSGFKPLIAQPLAGVLESAYRAELQAIVVALVSGRSVWGLGSHLVR